MFTQTGNQSQIPLQRKWQAVHSGFNSFDFNVKLIETQPNAKHQKITLSIQVTWEAEELLFRKMFKTSDLPSQAITIFSDVQTLYEYIDQFFNDPSRIKFNPEQSTFTIVNIVVMKNKELKQEIVLFLDREKLIIQREEPQIMDERSFVNNSQISSISSKQIMEESKLMIESLIKDQNAVLENRVQLLSEHLKNFINEIKVLKTQNKSLTNTVNSLNSVVTNLHNQTAFLNQKVTQLQNEQLKIEQTKQSSAFQIEEIKKQLSDHKWQLEQLNYSVANVHQSHSEIEKLHQKIQNKISNQQKSDDQYLPLITQMRKQIFLLNNTLAQYRQNSTRLGRKVFVNLQLKNNKYIDNFRTIENIVQKISGDEQRHQILGQQSFNFNQLKSKTFFEIKVISTAHAQVVIGIVGEGRKSERYSYDKKECVCYDGQGFIFEQGQKIKMPCQFYGGQTIRVVLDPFQCLIQWFVGYTEIGSASIPETMKKMRLYPYFELYCIGDKVAING